MKRPWREDESLKLISPTGVSVGTSTSKKHLGKVAETKKDIVVINPEALRQSAGRRKTCRE